MTTRTSAVLPLLMLTACATLGRAEPIANTDEEVRYSNGAPIVYSRGETTGVAIQPQTSATGRYKFEERLGFIIGVRNGREQPFEVSEASVKITVAKIGERKIDHKGRTILATEIEDSISSSAAWSHALATFGEAIQSSSASGYWERRQVAVDTANTHAAIEANRAAGMNGVSTLFQRNTVMPGQTYSGGIIFEIPRTVCGSFDDAPCALMISVDAGGEVHWFEFRERGEP